MNHLEPHSSSLKSSFLLTVAIKFQSVDCFIVHVIGSKDLSSTFKLIRCNARTIACVQTPQATEQNMLIFPVFFASQAYMLPDVIGSYDCTEY